VESSSPDVARGTINAPATVDSTDGASTVGANTAGANTAGANTAGANTDVDDLLGDVTLTDGERLALATAPADAAVNAVGEIGEEPKTERVEAPRPGRRWLAPLRFVSRHASGLITLSCLAAAVGTLVWIVHPSLVFNPTTPTGGDAGAHVAVPAYLRDHLLPHGRLFGWYPDNYGGFPVLQFYFPLPPLLVVLLDLILPYGVAFKLISVIGLVAMPVAAFHFGRRSGLAFPVPALMAIGALTFLFDRSYSIYGGNLPSSFVGEYHFTFALAMFLVLLGELAVVCGQRRNRARAAALVAAIFLSHLIVGLFALLAALVAVLVYAPRRRFRTLWYLMPALATFLLLVSFWFLPFLATHRYTADGNFDKLQSYWKLLFPQHMMWMVVLAVLAVAQSAIRRRERPTIFLAWFAVAVAVMFRVIPKTRLWNGRILPFFYLSLTLLAVIGAVEVARWVVSLRVRPGEASLSSLAGGWHRRSQLVAGISIGAVMFVHAALPVGAVPFSTLNWTTAQRNFLGLGAKDAGFGNWAQWNLEGYENKAAWPEYAGLNDLMASIGADQGCGRALWQYEADLTRFGSPMALDIMGYWTNGCVTSLEGLFIESSPTSPFHFMLENETTIAPSRPVFGLPYRDWDLNFAVPHMRLLGVRYFMAFSPEIVDGARARTDLTEIASYGRWVIFSVPGSDPIVGLNILPIVDPSTNGASSEAWLKAGLRVWDPISDQQFYVTEDGPASWPRIKPDGTLPTYYIDPATVIDWEITREGTEIDFDVEEIGKPVLVKVSYFPNWKVRGAAGPYRITPNLMVVVPTSKHVTLHYGRTGAEVGGMVLTGLGLLGVVSMFVLDRRRRRGASRRGASGQEGAQDGLHVGGQEGAQDGLHVTA
jgi:hypothetical protein